MDPKLFAVLLGQVAAGRASAVHPTQPLIAPKPKGKADLPRPLQQVSENVAQINNSGTQFNVRNTVVKQAVCQSPQSENNEPVNITKYLIVSRRKSGKLLY